MASLNTTTGKAVMGPSLRRTSMMHKGKKHKKGSKSKKSGGRRKPSGRRK